MLTFPTHLFNPARITLRPIGAVLTGGTALSGEQDVTRTDGGGLWEIAMEEIILLTPDQVRAWRAWEDHLEGGVQRVLVPVADVRNAPRPVIGGRLGRPSRLLATTDDPYFPEAVGFASPFIVARLVVDAALRATTVTIFVERGQRLRGGEVFALDHAVKGRRVYRVGRVLERNGQSARVTIRTPLREATPAGSACDFDWPSTVARLVPDTDISPTLLNGRSSGVNILFREAF